MASLTRPSLAIATGGEYVSTNLPNIGKTRSHGNTVPADSATGYAKGCIFHHLDGAADDLLYVNTGTVLVCTFRPLFVGFDATRAEINAAADMSARIVNVTATPLVMTVADHHNKMLVLDLAGGLAITLPEANAAAVGFHCDMIVKTTFSGASTVKSSRGADVMMGHAIMGNNSDNAVVNFQAVVGSTLDTIDLLGTGNSTGGMAGQRMSFDCLAANLWNVLIIGDAAGNEATPFADSVA